ncbi:MAG TPA: 4Fe-4S binding protein [Azospirillum sp.]|nr:4Fe-4S binding protein [Azospirillum sp.]
MDLETEVKEAARAGGADLVGICSVTALPEHAEAIERILPGARSLIVVAARHSLTAITSRNNQVGQFDTIHTYDECARAAHRVARLLESRGHAAAAVPAFIPLDMASPKHGMRGEISWRQAGYLAGLGSYGENGLLVTPEHGSAIRICGTLTAAPLAADPPLGYDACDHCMACVENCPTKALSGGGKIDKKRCGDHIFRYGFRAFQSFMADLWNRGESSRAAIEGFALRELWQNFMTGNYYYCFRCQTHCHRKSDGQ